MKASKDNPVYTTYVISGGQKYDLTSVVTSINISDREKQIAKNVTIKVANIQTDGQRLGDIISIRDRVYIYASDGSKKDEVFRGLVWGYGKKAALNSRELTLRCYDNLIYLQESEDSIYFSKGKSTKDVVSQIASKWGISISYNYSSITHDKLALRGTLSDILIDDLLNLVKDRSGEKYVILSEKDTMKIQSLGQNTTVYTVKKKENGVATSIDATMDDMTTQVVILGKETEDEREPVEATVSGDTGQYGTLQKLISRSENTSLADAKKEAQSIIDEDGEPTIKYSLDAPDIPWIRKGDRVTVNAGDINGSYIVLSIDRSITNSAKMMNLTLEEP